MLKEKNYNWKNKYYWKQYTNEDVIRGELIVDEGDPFTKLGLEKSIAEIKQRNIFKDVNYKVINGSEKNLKIIDIEVEEKPTER